MLLCLITVRVGTLPVKSMLAHNMSIEYPVHSIWTFIELSDYLELAAGSIK